MTKLRNFVMLVMGILAVFVFNAARAAAPGGIGGGMGGARRNAAPVETVPRSIAPYFVPIATPTKAPDEEGFLQRWLLLEPININIRTNAGLSETYVRKTILTDFQFENQLSVLPKDGDKTTANGESLAWHALDSTTFNVKVFRFAFGLNKNAYSSLYWFVTYVDSPREMPNVRLAVGSNSASIWWVNGKEVIAIYGDKHMIVDDGVSPRLTLNKGRNVVRGAIVNGPGLSDFCARFVDEKGDPVKDLILNLENAK